MLPIVSRFRGEKPGSILHMNRPEMDFLRAHSSDISPVESRPYPLNLVQTRVLAFVFRFLVFDFPFAK